MKIDSKYVYFTRFLPDVNAGGGCLRLIQIEQVFADIGLEFISSRAGMLKTTSSISVKAFKILKSRLNVLGVLEKHFVTDGEYHLWHREHRDYIYDLKLISRQWISLIENPQNIKLAFIDDPIYFSPLVKKLKAYGIHIIAMCHNMESLSYGQTTEKGQRTLFNKELDILSLCDMVITISREETVILNNLNIKAIFFPYYPADIRIKQFLNIREKRARTEKKDIILLGTAANKPTKHGMTKVIKAWTEYDLKPSCGRLLVAGYGTEVLKNVSQSHDIEFLGTLTNEELAEILSSVKACLCYQEKGSGALTRIPEMLIAGVPVIANTHAARSYYNSKGVTEFSCFEELQEAIKRVELVEGNIPVPTPPDLSILLSELKAFV